MRRLTVGAAVVGLALLLGLADAVAQDSPIPKAKARSLLRESGRSLEAAERARRAGDTAAVTQNISKYTQHQDRLNRNIARGNVRQEDALEIAALVDEATLTHQPILEGLLGTVPDQARPGISRALQVSRIGHDVATQAVLNRGRVDLRRGVLTDRGARDAMAKNEALLQHAQRGRRRGDSATVRRSVEQYTQNLGSVVGAIERGAVHEADSVSVLDRVDRNTRRHTGILEGLLGQVPAEARPGIERAIQASRMGNRVATEAIARTPAAGIGAGRPGAAGSPSGVGRPGGVSGPPAGISKGPAGKGGRP